MANQQSTIPITGPITPSTVVYIENEGDTDFVAGYDNNTYTIRPGQRSVIPYFAMCLWLGDPRAVDIDDKRRYRTDEYLRLRTRYGTYDDEARWFAEKPKLAAYDLDGNRLITVVDNYQGDHLKEASSTVMERDMLRQAVAEMQQRMEAMQAEMARLAGGQMTEPVVTAATTQKVAEPEERPNEEEEEDDGSGEPAGKDGPKFVRIGGN